MFCIDSFVWFSRLLKAFKIVWLSNGPTVFYGQLCVVLPVVKALKIVKLRDGPSVLYGKHCVVLPVVKCS